MSPYYPRGRQQQQCDKQNEKETLNINLSFTGMIKFFFISGDDLLPTAFIHTDFNECFCVFQVHGGISVLLHACLAGN